MDSLSRCRFDADADWCQRTKMRRVSSELSSSISLERCRVKLTVFLSRLVSLVTANSFFVTSWSTDILQQRKQAATPVHVASWLRKCMAWRIRRRSCLLDSATSAIELRCA